MSEPISQIDGNNSKTSALAIWSLVLGILSLICFSIFAAIPSVICGHMALSRIKNLGGALTGRGLAIAGLITGYIGIALAIILIPLMIVIGVPNFVRARQMAQANSCINQLRQIETAKQNWALENKKQPTDIPTESELLPYLHGPMPKCIAGGVYSLNEVDQAPTCSIPGHRITR